MKTEIQTLESRRLWLRAFRQSDAGDVYSLLADGSIADTTFLIPKSYTKEMAEDWISTHQSEFEDRTGITYAIVLKESSKLVGAISLIRIEEGHQAELGYWIGKEYWGKGICTEAAELILEYGFLDLGVLRIHARHMSRNPASGKVLLKIGMKHEGSLRKHLKKWGALENVEIYGVLIEDWKDANHRVDTVPTSAPR